MAEGNDFAHKDGEFVDESGWTSLEPEGAGNHPHSREEFPDIASQDRWEDDFGGQPGGDAEDHLVRDRKAAGSPWPLTGMREPGGDERAELARGPQPAEGDGWGSPG